VAGCKLVLCARRLEQLKRVKAELENLSVVSDYVISLIMQCFKDARNAVQLL